MSEQRPTLDDRIRNHLAGDSIALQAFERILLGRRALEAELKEAREQVGQYREALERAESETRRYRNMAVALSQFNAATKRAAEALGIKVEAVSALSETPPAAENWDYPGSEAWIKEQKRGGSV